MTQKETMNPIERLHAALDQNPVDRCPVVGVSQSATVELMEACGAFWPEAHKDPEKMAKLGWATYEIVGLEAVRIPFDVRVEAEACGAVITKWKKDNQPMVAPNGYPVKTPEDIDKLEVPDPHKDGRMPVVLKAIELLLPKCKEHKIPIVPITFTPFTSVNIALADMTVIMMWLKNQPELYYKLEKKALEIENEWARALIEAGADTIFYDGGVDGTVTREDFEKMVLPSAAEGAEFIKKQGAYCIYHMCAKPDHILDRMVDVGAHGISISQEIKMEKAREIVGDRTALVGNVDPLYTLPKKKPEDVIEEAKYCIDAGTDVLCPGCGFGPKTPLANQKALVEAGKKYGFNARLARKD
ncbi:MAG: MtaA/CmuA family methyltransferase [Candidatus Syntropharchaeia archaeon]